MDLDERDGGAFEPSAILADLKERAKAPQPAAQPDRLPLARIAQRPGLFQPRGISERHVSELARVIASLGEVDPVMVIQVGPEAVLIDGHHRVAAYQRSGSGADIPVRYFGGTLDEAVLEAGAANSRAKLPMSGQERQDYAWRLVVMGGYSKAEIARASGAASSQVAIMRKVLRELGDEALACRQWWQARERAQGKTEGPSAMTDDEIEQWKEDQANSYADRLSKEFGTKLSNNPEIAAWALAIYFGRRLGEVHEQLGGHVPEFAYELPENPDDPDF